MFTYLAAFFGYFLYVESASFIDLKDLCTFMAMAYLVPYTQEQLEEEWADKQNQQVTELIKDYVLGFDFDSAKKF
jgi:hypothetical protein